MWGEWIFVQINFDYVLTLNYMEYPIILNFFAFSTIIGLTDSRKSTVRPRAGQSGVLGGQSDVQRKTWQKHVVAAGLSGSVGIPSGVRTDALQNLLVDAGQIARHVAGQSGTSSPGSFDHRTVRDIRRSVRRKSSRITEPGRIRQTTTRTWRWTSLAQAHLPVVLAGQSGLFDIMSGAVWRTVHRYVPVWPTQTAGLSGAWCRSVRH
jgi:hypothetical protein